MEYISGKYNIYKESKRELKSITVKVEIFALH